MDNDAVILRDLAMRVAEIAGRPIQDERRRLWRRHNSFHREMPPIYVRAFAFDEFFDHSRLRCGDPLLRQYEYILHETLFRDTIGDDFIIEPYLTLGSVYGTPEHLRWGVPVRFGHTPMDGGAAAYEPTLVEEADIERVKGVRHSIDESATMDRYDKLRSALGDILTVHLDRGPIYSMWTGDISTDLAKLRGLEQIMWDAHDRPEWLHRLVGVMRDAILVNHDEAEGAGDLSYANHRNQAMPYAEELPDPTPCGYGVKRGELWGYMASQEFTGFSPDMFREFLLQYQIPILGKYGLVSYGCCEDLTNKIEHLRRIPNLRRIAVTPFADVRRCAEQIGNDYVISWRPNPASMISTGLDEDFVRKTMRENFAIFKGNGSHFDITLKDVQTVDHRPENISAWVRIVKEELEGCL